MTNLEAFQISANVTGNLLDKILLDRGIDASASYIGAETQKKAIDLALADLYEYMAGHPDIKRGSYYKTYSYSQLMGMARTIRAKYGENPATISGKSKW